VASVSALLLVFLYTVSESLGTYFSV
jgi:hypothetical protein